MINIAMTTRFKVTFDGDMSDLALWVGALDQAEKMLPGGLSPNLNRIRSALVEAHGRASTAVRHIDTIEIDEDDDG